MAAVSGLFGIAYGNSFGLFRLGFSVRKVLIGSWLLVKYSIHWGYGGVKVLAAGGAWRV
jgi:hypothetical protein